MRVCYLPHSARAPELAGAAWCRALGGDVLAPDSFAEGARAQASYDVILIDVEEASLETVLQVRRAIGAGTEKLVLHVARSLPDHGSILERFRAALAAADLVLAPQYAICLDVQRKTGVTACELLPPFEPGETPSPGAPRSKRALSVLARPGYSHADLRRELGPLAYWLTRLRRRVVIASPALPPAELAALVGRSALVYLPEAIEDGGALAAECAQQGALLVAPRSYDPAKFSFPFTTFGESDPRRRGLLLLWLQSSGEMAAFFRHAARRAVQQLGAEDRRTELFCKLRYRAPELRYAPRPGAPPSLLDQIRHRSGPRDVAASADECVLVSLVRNGAEHIPAFFTHYRALGVRRFVFIDNGSDDATLPLLEAEPGVTVYQTALPHKDYENQIRRLIIEQHCQRGFCLNVDIDELFDYPRSDRLSLRGLLAYLRRQGATAMAGYLLDMYDRTNAFGESAALDLKRAYPCYDLDDVAQREYHAEEVAAYCDRNTLAAEHVKTYFGGIRKRIFGSKNGEQYLLTKHPLIFLDGTLEPAIHPHYSNKARVADVSAVLYHYKFTPSFRAKVRESRASNRYVKFAQNQYDRYHRQIGARDALQIDTPGTRRLRGTEELVERGFIATSRAYEEHVARAGDRDRAVRAASLADRTEPDHLLASPSLAGALR